MATTVYERENCFGARSAKLTSILPRLKFYPGYGPVITIAALLFDKSVSYKIVQVTKWRYTVDDFISLDCQSFVDEPPHPPPPQKKMELRNGGTQRGL